MFIQSRSGFQAQKPSCPGQGPLGDEQLQRGEKIAQKKH